MEATGIDQHWQMGWNLFAIPELAGALHFIDDSSHSGVQG